jgi:2',3'-cyclic-nucleotide 2'-phosphodiesterase
MNVLFLGDVFGKPGREILIQHLVDLRNEFNIDFCIANGENVAQGRGITRKTAKVLFENGIDAFTSGNHLWDQRDSIDFLESERRILKPVNFPLKAKGNDYLILEKNNMKLTVFSLIGQAFMGPANSPFEVIDKYLEEVQAETNCILVDIHAEATGEKRALGFYLNGRVSAVLGTHTHIQTADEEILSEGTAYITDVGMTGPHDSVIGVKKEIILEKILSGMPVRHEISQTGLQINAVFIEIDQKSGKAVRIERIKRKIDGQDIDR